MKNVFFQNISLGKWISLSRHLFLQYFVTSFIIISAIHFIKRREPSFNACFRSMPAEGVVIGFALLVNFQIIAEFVFIAFLSSIRFFIHGFRFCFQKRIPKKPWIVFLKAQIFLFCQPYVKNYDKKSYHFHLHNVVDYRLCQQATALRTQRKR